MDFDCQRCGTFQRSAYYIPEVASVLEHAKFCSRCHFWGLILEAKNDRRSVRVDGVQYWILEGRQAPPFHGFDGRSCAFSSGDTFDWNGLKGQPLRIYLGMGKYARVLWRLGVIPRSLRDQLPDNHSPDRGSELLPEFTQAEVRANCGELPTDISCSADGRIAVCGTRKCDVLLFPLPGDGPGFLGVEHRGDLARLSPDGRYIASAIDEDLMVSDASTGAFLFRLVGHENAVLGLTFSPDGKLLASCGNRELMLSDLERRTTESLPTSEKLFDVAFLGPNQLVTCGDGGRLRSQDLRTGHVACSAQRHLGSARCLAVSPDGESILTGGTDQTVRLWDAGSLDLLAAYSAAGPVQSVCFSTTGELAFYGTDTSVGAIELESGATCLRHVMTINPFALLNTGVFVAAHPDGKRLLTASGDGHVRLWPLQLEEKKEEDAYPFLIMSPGAIQEFWLFLHSGSTDRAAALASRPAEFDEASRQRLLWEINQFERLLVAFWDNASFSFGTRALSEDEWFDRVVRGSPLDEVGVALLSECLDRQKRFWASKLAAGGADAEEAAVRLGIITTAHELFHERLGLSREAVERRCVDLWAAGPLWENGRASYEDLRDQGVIIVPADESPITQDELKSRLEAARLQAAAARAGGSHDR